MTLWPPFRAEVETWYDEYSAALLVFALAKTGDRSRAHDVLQQVFLRLLEHPNRRQIEDVRAYLFIAVRNAISNDERQRSRDVPLDLDETPWFVSPARDFVEELHLRKALASLPEEQREITVLHIWGGLTFRQAAAVLGINPNTAAARYRYALARLRENLSAHEEVSKHARGQER